LTDLDDPELRRHLDPEGAYERNIGLPQQCRAAWAAVRDLTLPPEYDEISQVVVAGMGGSAIAGDFLQAIAFHEGGASVTVVRGYELPAWVGPGTLVIACSHSGNTEETLSAFRQAQNKFAGAVVVTTGGQLLEEAKAAEVPAFVYDYPPEPRSGFGHGFLRLFAIAEAAGVLHVLDDRVEKALDDLAALESQIEESRPEESNPAKQLARRLHNRLPLVIGGEVLAPAAKRWRTQVEENAKAYAISDELPEMHHNTVVGLELPQAVRDLVHGVLLELPRPSERMARRQDLTIELFRRSGVSIERFPIGGSDSLGAMLRAVYFGNLVSYYLALLNGVHPAPVAIIDWLKAQLAQ
jgi:glucose/mannose-6-phosphate isomerase